MKRRHGYIALLRDADSGFAYWTGICVCGWRTQAGHLKRSNAAGALYEHIISARASVRVRASA